MVVKIIVYATTVVLAYAVNIKSALYNSPLTRPGVVTEGTCSFEQIPNKGIGVVAARDIAPGEKIMEEAPLFWLSTDSMGVAEGGVMPHLSPTLVKEALERVEREVNRLSKEDQRAYYELCGFDRLADQKPSDSTDNALPHAMSTNALDIFRTNALPMAKGKSGLFPTILRLNNDCRPNAHYNWDEDSQKATIYSICEIQEGQEICISYMGPYYPRRDRRGYLSRNFGFTCMCSVCTLTGEDAMLSDHRRATLAGLEAAAQTAASEGDGEMALNIAPYRLQMLQDEGLANAANLYKCELDVFFALSGMPSSNRSPDTLKIALSSVKSDNKNNLDTGNTEQVLDWINKSYNHAVECKGGDSSAARRCLSYLEVIREVHPMKN